MALSDFTMKEFCLHTYSSCFAAAFLFQWFVFFNTLYMSSGNLALSRYKSNITFGLRQTWMICTLDIFDYLHKRKMYNSIL